MQKRRNLNHRLGTLAVPIILPNFVFLCLIIYSVYKIGFTGLLHSGISFFIVFVLVNVSAFYALRSVFRYKVGVDISAVFATPLDRPGPMVKISFDEIETVDLKPISELLTGPNARANPSVIVLYRKEWDGQNLFILDPSRTNLKQFKDLVRMVHDRCPGTFTENALRYLNCAKLMTPRENRQGELVW